MKQLILLLAMAPLWLSAQSPFPPEQIIRLLNQRIAAGNTGYFDLSFRWKSMSNTDTTERSARIYFDRSTTDLDSIANYLIATPEGRFYYDGTLCYQVLFNTKTIVVDSVTRKGNIKRYTRGNLDRSTFSYFPFLSGKGKQPFVPEKYQQAQVTTHTQLGQQRLLLTAVDSFEVTTKLSPNDWDKGRYTEVFEIGQPRYNLLRWQEWVQRNETSIQYKELNFSPIFLVPTPNLPARVLNLDSLITAGYTLKGRTFVAPPRLAEVGDLLPTFNLPSLQGDSVASENLSGLLLIDFWYKGCGPCLMAVPGLEHLHQQYGKQGLTVLGINPFDTDALQLQLFIADQLKMTYPTLLDSDKKLSSALGITGYPTLLLVDATTRRILHVQRGYSPETELKLAELVKNELRN